MLSTEAGNNIVLTVLSSLLAANGLSDNNITTVIAAMLVSPYLGNIANIGYSLANDTTIFNDIFIVAAYIGVSLIVGFLYNFIQKHINLNDKDSIKNDLINKFNLSTKKLVSLLILSVVSGVTLAFVKDVSNSESLYIIVLAGISIAVALLPPTVASGMLISEGEYNNALNGITHTIVTIFGLIVGTYGYTYLK